MQLGYDTISGASPTGGYPSADVTTSASGWTSTNENFPQTEYDDSRGSGSLAYRRKFGAHMPSIDVSYSKENDYEARSIGLSDSWTMAGGRGTLHYGASISRDVVTPVTNDLKLAEGHERLRPRLDVGPRRAGPPRRLGVAHAPVGLPRRPVQGRPDRDDRRQRDRPRAAARQPPALRPLRQVRPLLPLERRREGELPLLPRRLVRRGAHARRDLRPEARLALDRLPARAALHADRRLVLREPLHGARRRTCRPIRGSPRSGASSAG